MERLIKNSIKLQDRSGIFLCDTSQGKISIFLPLPNYDEKDYLKFTKISQDDNLITIWGSFHNNYDLVIFGGKQESIIFLSTKNTWVCVN